MTWCCRFRMQTSQRHSPDQLTKPNSLLINPLPLTVIIIGIPTLRPLKGRGLTNHGSSRLIRCRHLWAVLPGFRSKSTKIRSLAPWLVLAGWLLILKLLVMGYAGEIISEVSNFMGALVHATHSTSKAFCRPRRQETKKIARTVPRQ